MPDRLDLPGVTGAELGWVERSESDADTQLHTVPYGRYRLCCRVSITERELRDWWDRLRACWVSEQQFASGYTAPNPERYRHRRDPTIGFHLIGNGVGLKDGFTVCWYAGLVKLGFDRHFSIFRFDTTFDDARVLQHDIESRLPRAQ